MFFTIWSTAKNGFKHSHLISRVVAGVISLFWFLQFVRDELLPTKYEEPLRLWNLLPHWSVSIWLAIAFGFLFLSFLEGTANWYRRKIAPLAGPLGSLQHSTAVLAADIGEFTRDFVRKHGPCPAMSPAADNVELERSWQWEAKFSSAFRASSLLDRLKKVLDELRVQQLQSPTADQLASLATINPRIALDAAGVIFEMGLWASLNG
jgi:hypothetical protein